MYSILEKLNKIEQNRLRKYVQSPYFNKNDTLVRLMEYFLEEINGGRNGELTKEAVWSELGLAAPYDDVRFRKYCSDLLKMVENFLAQQLYEEDPLQQTAYLMDAVERKKLVKLYKSILKTADRISELETIHSTDYYYHKYQIEMNRFQMMEAETNRAMRANVEDISNNLDYFYFGEKLRLYNFILSQRHIASHQYNFQFIDEITRHIGENSKYEQIPPIALYNQIQLTYTEPENETHYYKLKVLLDKFAEWFPVNQAKVEMYMSAQNYCIRKINQGNQHFVKELFILYKDLLKHELILADGVLSPWYFRNIVVTGLRLGEFEWTENFIHQYKDTLPEELRDNAVSFNLATFYFYQKKFDKVIELLQTVEYEDFTYNLNSKAMLIATYYEKDEIEPLHSLLESFRTYLNRNKTTIQEQRRVSFLNLIRHTKKLTRIIPGDKAGAEKLMREIEITKNVASIDWLKEKISELA